MLPLKIGPNYSEHPKVDASTVKPLFVCKPSAHKNVRDRSLVDFYSMPASLSTTAKILQVASVQSAPLKLHTKLGISRRRVLRSIKAKMTQADTQADTPVWPCLCESNSGSNWALIFPLTHEVEIEMSYLIGLSEGAVSWQIVITNSCSLL